MTKTKPNVLIVADPPEWRLIAAQFISKFQDLANYQLVSTLPPSPGSVPLSMVDFNNVKDGTEPVFGVLPLTHFHMLLSFHCRQIIPAAIANSVVCINVHPSYLPWGRGWRPPAFALARQEPAGATLHMMDAGVDTGQIIVRGSSDARTRVTYDVADTVKTLYEAVHKAEKELLWEWWPHIVSGEYTTRFQDEGISSNDLLSIRKATTRQDYDRLCNLGTLTKFDPRRRLLAQLAGLTYGDERNAHFTTPEGEKVRVGITLERVPSDDS